MKQGASFFELLIAIVVVGAVLVVMAALAVGTLGKSTLSKNEVLASRYTQQALEWLRDQRDSDWSNLLGHASGGGRTWCLRTLTRWPSRSGGCGSSSVISQTSLRREALLRRVDSNTIEAVVVTFWEDSSGRHESRAATLFTNWKQQ